MWSCVEGTPHVGGEPTVSALTRTAFFITNPVLLFTVVLESDLPVVFSAYAPLALITAGATAVLYVLVSRLWFRRPLAPLVLTLLDFSASGRFSPRLLLTQPFRNPTIIASLLGVMLAFGMSLRGTRMLQGGGIRRKS